VQSLRKALSAIALAVTTLGMATVPAFAFASHPTCTAKHHDCGKAPTITTCCCGDEQSSQTDSTPGRPRVEVHANVTAVPVGVDVLDLVTSAHALVAARTAPPHQSRVDLPTLFASLLI
jgi:hypothetical protein